MNAAQLRIKLKPLNDTIPEIFTVRLHRAISWLKCAEEYKENLDIQFITLWISFNACYSIDEKQQSLLTEKENFNDFVEKLAKNDIDNRFFYLLWNKFSGPVRLLIENEYIFKPFWDFQRGIIKSWKKLHAESINDANKFLAKQEIPKLLGLVLDRLYMLRNQIIHGGATYKSKVNRAQVKDACNILSLIIPIIIDIMIENGHEDWGEIYYPVIASNSHG